MKTLEQLKSDTTMWDKFTQKKAYSPSIVDRYGRTPLYSMGDPDVFNPSVSEWLKQHGLKVTWPDGRNFALCLTHDIDFLRFPLMDRMIETMGELVEKRVYNAIGLQLGGMTSRLNHLFNFERTIRLERAYGAKSTFFFFGRAEKSRRSDYTTQSLRSVLMNIAENGWEIGLHGTNVRHEGLEAVRKEKKHLEDVAGCNVTGCRNHGLRFEIPSTWNLIADAGLKYDSTLCYPDCAGFRNGMCYPFRPYDLKRNAVVDLLEIPINISDNQLFDYMRLDANGAWSVIQMLIDRVESLNGVLTLLWHNTTLAKPAGCSIYERVLEYCKKRNAWMTSAERIRDWWEKAGYF